MIIYDRERVEKPVPVRHVCRTEYCVNASNSPTSRCKACVQTVFKFRNGKRKELKRLAALALLRLERIKIALGPMEQGGTPRKAKK